MQLRIKEFADFCNVSVRALHLYDRTDLFHPCRVDQSNGYRYYDTDQMLELSTIISLKKVGFTLKEIKEMKEQGLSKDMVNQRITEKIEENRRQIEIASYNINNLEQMLKGSKAHQEKPDQAKEALHLSKIMCLDNDKLENEFYQILWL
jgi:DNA-binding transcriptional MerR regulator